VFVRKVLRIELQICREGQAVQKTWVQGRWSRPSCGSRYLAGTSIDCFDWWLR